MDLFPRGGLKALLFLLTSKVNINYVENYRGITLLSLLVNSFTRVRDNRLQQWVEKYNVYIKARTGFRAKLSIVDNIFERVNFSIHLLTVAKPLTIWLVKTYGINTFRCTSLKI